MMGRRTEDQGQLFYSLNLDAAVPDDIDTAKRRWTKWPIEPFREIERLWGL